jgi:hypothetical protein
MRWMVLALLSSTAFADTTLPEAGPRLSVRWRGARTVLVTGDGFPTDEKIGVSINEYNDDGFMACGRDFDVNGVDTRPDARGHFGVKLRIPPCAERACKTGGQRLAAHAAFACGLDCFQGVVARFACRTDSP